jgi:hypothetical protein
MRLLVLGLLSITRFEGFVLALLILISAIGIYYWRNRQWALRTELLLLVIFIGSWFLLRWMIFNEWTPLPTQAKSGGLAFIAEGRPEFFFDRFMLPGIEYVRAFFHDGTLLTSVALAIAAISYRFLSTIQVLAIPVIVVGFASAVAVSNGGDWIPGYRLLTPVFGVVLLAGLYSARELQMHTLTRARVLLVALLLLPALFSFPATRLEASTFNKASPNYLDDLGRWLDTVTEPDDLVLVSELGRVSYYAPGTKIIDLHGLANKEVAKNGNRGALYGKRLDNYSFGLFPAIITTNSDGVAERAANFYSDHAEQEYLWMKLNRTNIIVRYDVLSRTEFQSPAEDIAWDQENAELQWRPLKDYPGTE